MNAILNSTCICASGMWGERCFRAHACSSAHEHSLHVDVRIQFAGIDSLLTVGSRDQAWHQVLPTWQIITPAPLNPNQDTWSAKYNQSYWGSLGWVGQGWELVGWSGTAQYEAHTLSLFSAITCLFPCFRLYKETEMRGLGIKYN